MGKVLGIKLNPQILKKELPSLVGLTVLGIESYAVGDDRLIESINMVLGYPDEDLYSILKEAYGKDITSQE